VGNAGETPALPASAPSSCLSPHLRMKILIEQFQDAFVFVSPTLFTFEAMIFDGIRRDFPVRLAKFDQLLDQADSVLEIHVGINHAVTNQQRTFQTAGKVNG